MARVFISHSSRDLEPAARMKAWLHGRGFDTPFLDFDKHAGIPPGANWEKVLYREIERSEAVIIIQTPNWLDSKWCFAEFTQARALGKAIFPIVEAPTGETLIAPDIQTLNLLVDRQGGLERLARELTRIAVDAQSGFEWDSKRSIYPGLHAFQEQDAAIYFGRDDEIRRLIERLNARRAHGGVKIVAVLGASGCGKSSLLRAGVVPRLRRDPQNWIVLAPFRPQVRPIEEFARSILATLGREQEWRALREQLSTGDVVDFLRDIAADLRAKRAATEAQILVPVDQAEELFTVSEPEQASRFLAILNSVAQADLPFIFILAQRSDYLEALQSSQALTARFEEFSLPPMPLSRIAQIVEGPAKVAGLSVEDALVARIAQDAQTDDALPLLAFALRALYERVGPDGALSLRDYQALGDAKGGLSPIENSVRKAADDVIAEASPSPEALQALREAFIPAMVRLSDNGEFVRQAGKWGALPQAAHGLLEKLRAARLLVFRGDGADRIVEVSHEALLRKWPRLSEWLEQEREFLTWRNKIDVARRAWEGAPGKYKDAALLTGYALLDAIKWSRLKPAAIAPADRSYIDQSIPAERVDIAMSRPQKLTVVASFIGLILSISVASFSKLAVASNPIAVTGGAIVLFIATLFPIALTLRRNNKLLEKLLGQSYPIEMHALVREKIALRETIEGREFGGWLLAIGSLLVVVIVFSGLFCLFWIAIGIIEYRGVPPEFKPGTNAFAPQMYAVPLVTLMSGLAFARFMKKKRDFRFWFAGLCTVPLIAIGPQLWQEQLEVGELIWAAFPLICLAYVVLSKRAKATFIR